MSKETRPTSKIIQIATTSPSNPQTHGVVHITNLLCKDGSVWEGYQGKWECILEPHKEPVKNNLTTDKEELSCASCGDRIKEDVCTINKCCSRLCEYDLADKLPDQKPTTKTLTTEQQENLDAVKKIISFYGDKEKMVFIEGQYYQLPNHSDEMFQGITNLVDALEAKHDKPEEKTERDYKCLKPRGIQVNCVYSKSMDQTFPRKCVNCDKLEKK